MGDVPEDFLDDFARGEFPAREAVDWLRHDADPETQRDVNEFLDAGLSLEWAFAAADQDMPHPSEWDHVTLDRDMNGDWDVIITAGGETFTIDAADNDEIAADTIWADFWFHVIDEYDIDVDKDISSPGGD